MCTERLDHVCVLVGHVERAAEKLSKRGLFVGSLEHLPKEGTREIYVGAEAQPARLLLVEAVGPGPYASALAARGCGLHHLGVVSSNVEEYVDRLAGTGWYVHPRSFRRYPATHLLWLARPGVPTLVEVVQAQPPTGAASEPVVSWVEVPVPAEKPRLLEALGTGALKPSPDSRTWLTVAGFRLDPRDLG